MFGLNGRKAKTTVPPEETFTFLARGFEFKGLLTLDGTVRIDGNVYGTICTKGALIMGEHAVIEGDVSAGTIVSGGTIHGNVIASEKVHLLASAALLGDVKTPLLQVEEGVRFLGSCEAEGSNEPIHDAGHLHISQREEAP